MAENPPKLPPKLIDAGAHRRYRARASAGFAGVNYIKMAAVERVVDRLEGMTGGFALALDVGAHHGELGRAAIACGKVGQMVSLEPAPPMAAVIPRTLNPLVMDYDAAQFFPNVFDAVVSAFALHWVDDLAGLLVRMRGWLKPDGLLLLALAGGGEFCRVARVSYGSRKPCCERAVAAGAAHGGCARFGGVVGAHGICPAGGGPRLYHHYLARPVCDDARIASDGGGQCAGRAGQTFYPP